MPKMHSHQIGIFYVFRFQGVTVQNQQFFSYFSVAILSRIVAEDQLLESWIEFIRKAANLEYSDPLFCFDNRTTECTWEPRTCSNFWKCCL